MHVYVRQNVAYVAGARQHEFANNFVVKKYGRDRYLRKYKAWLIGSSCLMRLASLQDCTSTHYSCVR